MVPAQLRVAWELIVLVHTNLEYRLLEFAQRQHPDRQIFDCLESEILKVKAL